jgi:N-methylhydantoinase A
MASGWQLGVDIGGTFTDVVAFHPKTGTFKTAKVASRSDDPIASLLDALNAVDVPWHEVDDLVHGTTMVTNAIVEDRLPEVALVCTEGFADTLAIGRQSRRHLYRLDLPPKLPPQVSERLRFEVRERLDVNGEILIGLTDEAVEEIVRKLHASGVKTVAVSLLHAFSNPVHEKKLGTRLKAALPYVALSHRVNPEAREFERTSTTVLSAGLMPLVTAYLDRLKECKPMRSRLHLFHSAGGMASAEALRELPVGLALSGPAAGVSAAGRVATELAIDSAISFDMGGTTTDVCLVVGGHGEIRSERSIGGRPLRQPMLAVESIGAGGGSIARLDTGTLRVGPASAGADPGPACYGRGGAAATVTDANLALGYLDPDRPLGNGLRLDPEAAKGVLAPLAMEIGVDVTAVALGIVRVANANMARALRRVTVERGIDGRQCTLLAFGGAGPIHAAELARLSGISHVVVPRGSSVFSAFGCLTADMSYSQQQTVRIASTDWDRDYLTRIRGALVARLAAPLKTAGHHDRELMVEDVAAVRYSGQSYAVEVPRPALDDPDRLGRDFQAQHQTLYGFATDEPWELVALRVKVSIPRRQPFEGGGEQGERPAERDRVTPCYFSPDRLLPTPRYARTQLVAGQRFDGPAVVEDTWSTVVVPPGAALTVDVRGHLHIEVEDLTAR